MNNYQLPTPLPPQRDGRAMPPAQHIPPAIELIENEPEKSDFAGLQEMLDIVLHQWRGIAAATLIALALGLLYILVATRMYGATATLDFPGYSPMLSGSEIESALSQRTKDQKYLSTQLAKLEHLSVADQVLSDPDTEERVRAYLDKHSGGMVSTLLVPLRWILGSGNDRQPQEKHYKHDREFLHEYLKLIDVSPVYGTSLVDVTATTADPELSQELANRHSRGFIQFLRDERRQNLIDKLEFLNLEGEELEKQVAAAEQELAQYAEENKLITLSEDENVVVQEINELTKLLSEATATRIRAESVLREIEQRPLEETNSLDNDAIRDTLVELNRLEAEYADLGSKVTPLYPRMKQLKARIDSMKDSIRRQRLAAKERLEAEYQSALEAEKEFEKRIEATNTKAHSTSKRLVQYNILRREYDSLKDLHQSVIRQRKEVQLSSAHQGTEVLVSDPAAFPQDPSAPRKGLIIVFALALGLSAGIGLALFREFFRRTIRTSEELSKHLGVPGLGIVPHFPSGEETVGDHLRRLPNSESKALPDGLGKAQNQHSPEPVTPPSRARKTLAASSMLLDRLTGEEEESDVLTLLRASEAFQTLSTFILLSSANSAPTSLLVSSASKGEGKTTVISNLALSFARSRKKVLLVDADVRQPKLHRRFNIDESKLGLVDYLAGQAELNEVLVKHSDNLSIIPAGSFTPSPTELFASQTMQQLIDAAKKNFDLVILDSSPILPVADSLILSNLVDKVVVVVRSGKTKRRMAQEALRRLRKVRASILGVVLNDSQEPEVMGGRLDKEYASSYYIMPDNQPPSGRRRVG